MRTIAANASDFASIRTMDGANSIYVDKTHRVSLSRLTRSHGNYGLLT